MSSVGKLFAAVVIAGSLGVIGGGKALAHGDAAPQPIDTTGLDAIGEEWVEANPYRNNELAIQIGKSGYNQNCARCHGLGAVSGGISPDLRYLEPGDEGDEWYVEKVRYGVVRNGMTYMPPFGEILGQEGLWAIRAWLETVYTDE
jgi:cytochrome c-550 PedF